MKEQVAKHYEQSYSQVELVHNKENVFTLRAIQKGATEQAASKITLVRIYFDSFAKFSQYLNQILCLKRLQVAGLLLYDDLNFFQNGSAEEEYVIDLVMRCQFQSLERIQSADWNYGANS